ncbi:MAG: YdcF family protein [Chloroflexi bacterium]|nr:YdcF family protein [Chloroflexota bacterium]
MQSQQTSSYRHNGTAPVKSSRYNQAVTTRPEPLSQLKPAPGQVATRPSRRKRRPIRWLLAVLFIVVALVLSPFVVVQLIKFTNQSKIYTEVPAIPARPVAIVFGAGLNRDGTPSRMLSDRLDGAIDLYKAGKVEQLLLTGDEVTNLEISAMRSYAIQNGIPASKILTDKAGLRTYDSCYRANHNFGITSAILVTQGYHLPRALFLCNGLGIDAVGFKAGRDDYPNQDYYNQREFLATFLSWVDITITHPEPEIQD